MEQFKLLSACAFGSLIVSDPKLFEDISTWRDSTSRYQGGGLEDCSLCSQVFTESVQRRCLIFAQEFVVDCFPEMHSCRKGFEASTGH